MKFSNKNKLQAFYGPPPEIAPLQVIVEHGDFDSAFRLFKAIVQKEKIVSNYKERQSYEKPSEKRRRKRREARERRYATELRQRQIDSGEWEKKMKKKMAKKKEKEDKRSSN